MLSPYRVLDLSDERGHLCGQILAGLGADVIAVEPPGGSRSRRLGPFADDIVNPERSLTHFAYNRGKRSIVLDLDSSEGRDQLLSLLATADVLVESERPGRMAELGLDHSHLLAELPHLVVASVTAFGQTGPKANWQATDLTIMASACTLAVTGDDDRPPVRVTSPQGFHFGAASAACGVIAALLERARSGVGQHVDAAAQWTATLGTQAGILGTGVGSIDATRSAGGALMGDLRLRLVYPAADGHVSITHVFGMPIGLATARLMQWVHEAGFCDETLRDKDWVGYLGLIESGAEPIEEWERAKAAVAAFTASKTKAELLVGAMERRLLMAPIASPVEVLHSEQLGSRAFFEAVDHPTTGRSMVVPGPFAKCSGTPLRPLGPAPTIGQHDGELLRASIGGRSETGPAQDNGGPSTKTAAGFELGGDRPLSGLRVLDLTWSIAGPHALRLLADLGATVVKVESAAKQDPARGYRPVHNDEAGLENSALFDTMAAGKQSLALNLSKPESLDVVRDLVRWCDVVVESFSPRAMPSWGLDYESLRTLNPSLIMASTCLAGQTGPLAEFAGYGNLGAAFAGFYGLAGWPDRPPAGPFGAYTDYTSTHLLAATLLAAIDHRRRTGEGQHIDMAQSEAAQYFLAPALLQASHNGSLMNRAGNRDAHMSPHGVYPTTGDDQWIAIACETDDQWRSLADLMDRPDLSQSADLVDAPGRVVRAEELDQAMAEWTCHFDAVELAEELQAKSIAAHPVNNGAQCLADDQLRHAGHFVTLTHPDRTCLVENTRFRLSRSPVGPVGRAPMIGEHTMEILGEILGYDVEQIAGLAAAEVLE